MKESATWLERGGNGNVTFWKLPRMVMISKLRYYLLRVQRLTGSTGKKVKPLYISLHSMGTSILQAFCSSGGLTSKHTVRLLDLQSMFIIVLVGRLCIGLAPALIRVVVSRAL